MQCVGGPAIKLLEIKKVRGWHKAVRDEYLEVSRTASEISKDGESRGGGLRDTCTSNIYHCLSNKTGSSYLRTQRS